MKFIGTGPKKLTLKVQKLRYLEINQLITIFRPVKLIQDQSWINQFNDKDDIKKTTVLLLIYVTILYLINTFGMVAGWQGVLT